MPVISKITGAPFRFWCQKILPAVYDDSLSYYELLCKVVDYLNKVMEDDINVVNLVNELEEFVNNYFDNLDVQQEINNKLDAMAQDGSLLAVIAPHLDPIIEDYEATLDADLADYKGTIDADITEFKGTVNNALDSQDAEISNFKNTVNGQVSAQNTEIANFTSSVNATVAEQDNDISVMQSQMDNFIQNHSGELTFTELYNTTEALGAHTVNEAFTLSDDYSKYPELDIYWSYNSVQRCTRVKTSDVLATGVEISFYADEAVSASNVAPMFFPFMKIVNGNTAHTQLKIDSAYSERWSGAAADSASRSVPTSAADYSAGSIIKVNGVSYQQDAEVIDIRVGYDGTEYITAGDSVRGQVEDIYDTLTNTTTWKKLNLSYTDGGYIRPSDGNITPYETWHYTDLIDIRANNVSNEIYVTGTINSAGSIEYNAFYNDAGEFISSFNCTAGTVSIPDNARYVRLSYPKASEFVQTLSIKEYTVLGKLELLESNVIDDSVDVKAQLCFEPGGVATGTGQNYNGREQQNRLRSKILKSTKPITLFTDNLLESPLERIYLMVFYWTTSAVTAPRDATSGWLEFPATSEYTIPANTYFRILMYSNQSPSAVTDVKSNIVYRAMNITSELPKQIGIRELNECVQPYIQSLKMTYPPLAKSYFNAIHTPLTMAHFSDIHNRPILWKRIAEYIDANSEYISFALHTGDYVGDNQSSYTDLYDYYMPAVPFLNCVGNHDTYANAQHEQATKQSVYEKLFNHTQGWGVTFMSGNYSMTYYKDFPTANIRLIVLDNYYNIEEQKTWLSDTLDSAKLLGYSVITASHQVTGRPVQKIACSFQTLIPYETAGTGSVMNTEFDNVIGDFITNGGKHIVHLAGHEHQDWFYKTQNNVLNCAVECATDYIGWTEGARVVNTKTMDCFNAMGIDTDLGIIKIVRVGANSDSHNRAKNILCYDYINNAVLSNE